MTGRAAKPSHQPASPARYRHSWSLATATLLLMSSLQAGLQVAWANGSVGSAAPWPARLQATIGHALVVPLPAGVSRVAVGDPAVADYQITAEGALYLLGKSPGTTNLLLWSRDGQHRSATVEVQPDAAALAHLLERVFPQESDLQVMALPGGLVLRGSVADGVSLAAVDAVARQFVSRMAGAGRPSNTNSATTAPGSTGFAPGTINAAPSGGAVAFPSSAASSAVPPASLGSSAAAPLVNLLTVRDPQQVVLEVKIAEVSKSLVERMGVRTVDTGQQTRWSLVSQFSGNAVEGTLGLILGAAGLSNVVLDAQKNDGLVKILAEPNIVALSGHEGRFLVGGRIFIPVSLPSANGGVTTTLEERPFGVSLGFTPTVMAGAKVQLKVKAEVSEVAREPLRFSAGNTSTVLPSITSRDVSTTVQMLGSQSLVIGGLLRSNRSQSVKAFPILGELPIIGALFRSTDFNDDETELVIVVTPRLVSTTAVADGRTSAPTAPALPATTSGPKENP